MAQEEKGKLLWFDDFSQDGELNGDKWKFDLGGHGWGNNEEQCYTRENARVSKHEGGMVIETRKEECQGRSYSSSRVLSIEAWSPPVVIEIRAKVPTGRGVWPALWMLPDEWKFGDWPNSGEIDIMEHVGFHTDTIFGSVHTQAFNHMKDTQITKRIHIPNISADFHTFRCVWTKNSIKLSIDEGLPYFVYEKKPSSSALAWEEWPFEEKFRLLFNIAVGGNWGGSKGIDESIFPLKMIVEYVKVWELIVNEEEERKQQIPYPVSFEQAIPCGSVTCIAHNLDTLLCAKGSEVTLAHATASVKEGTEHLWSLFRAGKYLFLQTIGSRLWLSCTSESLVSVSEDKQPWLISSQEAASNFVALEQSALSTSSPLLLVSIHGHMLTADQNGNVRAVSQIEENPVNVHIPDEHPLSAVAASASHPLSVLASLSQKLATMARLSSFSVSSSSPSISTSFTSPVQWKFAPQTVAVLDGPVLIFSDAHMRYLSSTFEGVVTLSSRPDYWQFSKIENTGKYHIRSATTNRFLGSTPQCSVDTTYAQEGWQEWEVEPASTLRSIFIRSSAHRSVMGAVPEGTVDATYVTQTWQQWHLM